MLYNETYKDYQLNRSFLRKLIRRFYLRNQASFVTGLTIDFGCGIGELLPFLPLNSIGMEVNKSAVEYCQSQHLNVQHYDLDDNYHFDFLPENQYKTLVISHVLEHLEQPEIVLKKMISAFKKKGISRLIVIVPNIKGFNSDRTHLTFINKNWFLENKLSSFSISKQFYFPLNIELFGKFFTHHELITVYDLNE